MKNPIVKFSALASLLLFSIVYGLASYMLLKPVDHTVFLVVGIVVSLVLYLNILRFFIFEIYSLGHSRVSEWFFYGVLYALTFIVLLVPLWYEPVLVFESGTLRLIIMAFAILLLLKYTVFMILGPWHDIIMRLRHSLYFADTNYQPLVSVIIPAWNEEVGILSTVRSLLKSTYQNIEIIVVNDGSTDASDALICDFLRQHNNNAASDTIPIIYRYQQNTGKGGALNHALGLSSGDIIVSVDADCYVEPNAIEAFVSVFKDPQVGAAVGNVKVSNQDNTVGIVQYLEFLFSFYFKRADALLGSIYIIGGAAGAFRRSVFDKVGGYSETNITEDIDLTVRIQDAGLKVEYASDAVVYTEGAHDLASLKKQRLRWKRGRLQTFYQHRHMFFSTKKQHNKVLTWLIMPLAVVQEVQLLFELPFILFLYVFSVLNTDVTSYMVGVVVVSLMFVVQLMFYDKSTRHWSFVALAPIGWLLFYIATYVEAWALVQSIRSIVFRQAVTWQRWERHGALPKVAKPLKVEQ